METKILEINPIDPDMDKIEYAASILRRGGLVAFPTETVYGLGADALNERAVENTFKAKGRPADNPLIVHIWDISEVDRLVSFISEDATKLMRAFWPGPLTLVMKKSSIVPDIITGGLDTVAIRIPCHPIARQLIKASGVPISAPSANISGKPSPTLARHVIADLLGKVDVIIDGGACKIGVESTVIDMTVEPPVLLRPGDITHIQLEKILGHVKIDAGVVGKIENDIKPRSPGMKYTHYSPKAEVMVVEGEKGKVVEFINSKANESKCRGLLVGILALDNTKGEYEADKVLSVGDADKPETIAATLFAALREMDEAGVDIIFTQSIDEGGVGMAIRNRLFKAAGYNIFKAGE